LVIRSVSQASTIQRNRCSWGTAGSATRLCHEIPDRRHFWVLLAARISAKYFGREGPVDVAVPSPKRKHSTECLVCRQHSLVERRDVRNRSINGNSSASLMLAFMGSEHLLAANPADGALRRRKHVPHQPAPRADRAAASPCSPSTRGIGPAPWHQEPLEGITRPPLPGP
jgi:hypothetical protein